MSKQAPLLFWSNNKTAGVKKKQQNKNYHQRVSFNLDVQAKLQTLAGDKKSVTDTEHSS